MAIRLRVFVPVVVVACVCAGVGAAFAANSPDSSRAQAAAGSQPPSHLTARRLRPRRGALPRGTVVNSAGTFSERVFPNEHVGFMLADVDSAQYPALTTDGGRTWRIDGPQVHVDAADGPEAVGFVGAAGPRVLFTYGSSVVDATTNAGRTWWQTFLGELVVAVVAYPPHELVAYVQQSASNDHPSPAVTSQYVSRDGGRHWYYSTALGGW